MDWGTHCDQELARREEEEEKEKEGKKEKIRLLTALPDTDTNNGT